jgi:hypothetical protein
VIVVDEKESDDISGNRIQEIQPKVRCCTDYVIPADTYLQYYKYFY